MSDKQLEAALRLYGALETPDYPYTLLQFCRKHGWEVHPNQDRRCVKLLESPAHRCAGRCTFDYMGITLKYGIDPSEETELYHFDHTVLLRRGPVSHPTQWAILSQPYSDANPGERAVDLGLAPYGHGTTALLYVGKKLDT